ncbi:dTMP kinase [Thalassotalea ganghwensis]
MTKGKFIVIEGIEGAGKSTAIEVVKDVLATNGIEFICTREPGGTSMAESLREIVKSADHEEVVTEETELFLMYAARSQLLANKILPALNQGIWVVGDRHDLSSRAYQGGGRQINDQIIEDIAKITLKGFTPDLTLYLDISPEIGLQRARNRGALDRIELEKIEFFHRVRNKYLEFAQKQKNIVTIDASVEVQNVHQNIKATLNQFIKTI